MITDLDGNYRVYNGTVDIGAYEFDSIPILAGDANYDGCVDGSDVTILACNWQAGIPNGDTENVTWSMGDFNSDGKVDGSDVTILAGNWQAGVNSTTTVVSESESARQFVPPVDVVLEVATVLQRESLPSRKFIVSTPEPNDVVLAESTWTETDYTAIAKDLVAVSVKKSTAVSEELFALELDLYTDLG